MCGNDHSLSPWHSKITLITTADGYKSNAFRSTDELDKYLQGVGEYEIVGHNFKFDWLHLAVKGLKIDLDKWVGDSQLAAYVSTEKIPDQWLADYEEERKRQGSHHRRAGKHSLKTLAPYFLGVQPFWEAEEHDNVEYGIKDAEYTLRLTNVIEEVLKKNGQFEFYRERQLEWTKMLVRAELRGVHLDMPTMATLKASLQKESAALEADLSVKWAPAHEEYHKRLVAKCNAKYDAQKNTKSRELRRQAAISKLSTKINYASPDQMAWLLRDFYGHDITTIEDAEVESTGAEVLERLAEKDEAVATFLKWRGVNKILTSFIPTYEELQENSTLHPIFNPDSTRTGRTSCERPNYQQVPGSLKSLTTARSGFKFIGYDAAAIEARLIALYTNDPELYRVVDSGVSIHDLNAKIFFDLDVHVEDVKKAYPGQRGAAKNVGFALFYNAGARRIQTAFAQKGFILAPDQCKAIWHRFLDAYSVSMAFSRGVVNYLEDGNILTNLTGRPIRIENPQDAYMKGFNRLIQSSASDIILEGSLRADRAMKAANIEAYPVIFVHDFVCFEVAEAQAEEANKIIVHSLTNFPLKNEIGPIKLDVEGGIMDKWEK